jgi:alcohol dehydrogenase class IV
VTGSWTHTAYPQRLVFGDGAVGEVPSLLRDLGARRVLLLTTEGRLASEEGRRVVGVLGRTLVSTFAGVRPHLPTSVLQAALQQVRRDGVDAVVSFGGGSCVDLGKAVNFFAEQEAGTPGRTALDRPLVPHLAIPLTCSGAECTGFFGTTDERTRAKSGAGGPTCTPGTVIYDPALVRTVPSDVLLETAMNALAHCLEVVYGRRRSPEAEAVAIAGAAALVDAAPRLADHPGQLAAVTDLLSGACLAGRALQNGSTGVHHGLAQLLGGRTGVRHGLANAVLLPHTMAFNAEVASAELARVGAAIGTDDVPAALGALLVRLGLPTRLREVGVEEADLDAVARQSQAHAGVRGNPRPATEEDARAILAAAW